MTSYGYIIMIIFDSCIIWFHLDYIMQLKLSCYIATNVSSRKSATTFGISLTDQVSMIQSFNITMITTGINALIE